MSKASVEDLIQMYQDSLCIYKNKPYYVLRVKHDRMATCLNLLTQKQENLPIDEETWHAPTQRIGYVNIQNGVGYCTRTPIRRYKVGLSKENFIVKMAACKFLHGVDHAKSCIQNLTCLELGQCLLGKYPSFKEAVNIVKEQGACVAFDRQFAINPDGKVAYKGLVVGSYKKSATSVNDIIFNEGFKYLSILLDNNYEKALSTAGSR